MKTTQPKVLGLGGFFFRSAKPTQIRAWYARHFGLAIEFGKCAVFDWDTMPKSPRLRQTVWTPFEQDTDYFGNRRFQYMMNFIVNDLDGLLAKLRRGGVKISDEPIDESYGRFAWVFDPEGRKIELWEPPLKPRGKKKK